MMIQLDLELQKGIPPYSSITAFLSIKTKQEDDWHFQYALQQCVLLTHFHMKANFQKIFQAWKAKETVV